MVDGFWKHVKKNNNGYACKLCGFQFSARISVSRIKFHLSGIENSGVTLCTNAPDDVKQAAKLAVSQANQVGKKRRKPMPSSSNDVLVQNPMSGLEQMMEGAYLSGIELENWVDSITGGELVINDQGRAPEELPGKGKAFQTTELVGRAFERNVGEIMSWLMKDDVSSIGIHGIGGVGKTSLLGYINDQLLQRPSLFENVFWVTVMQNFSIYKLQDLIAKAVDLDLSNEEDEKKRAVKLSNGLIAKKKFVLILDDLWNHFSPEKVGVPVGVNGCKLILASRSLRVCRQMCVQEKIKVEPLNEDEAWTLFMKKLALNVELPSEVIENAKSIAKECAGLPPMIIAMAGSMKQVDDIGQWSNALKKLKESKSEEGGIEADMFDIIKLSYENLNDTALQQAFLYSALLPVDFGISREDLVEYMIVEGIVVKRKSRQAESDKGHAMLNKLENACLIESFTRGGYRYVQMNTLVRDMAIKIQKMNSQVLVECGAQLEKLPDIEKWTEDLGRVSLMKSYIIEIPASYSPRCPKLSTLLLSQNYMLKKIAGSFFTQLNGLAVLDLSETAIKSLPGSISDLVCLTALLLGKCRQLRHVPTLANLKALKKLDLVYTQLEELPEGMQSLSNLRYLDLSHTRLKQLSAGILPKLCRLQVLRVLFSSETQVTLKGDELACLKRLEALECNFCDLIDFSKYVKSWEETQPPRAYYFIAGPAVPSLSGIHKTIQVLEIVQCHDMTSLCVVSSMKHAVKLLKSLVIRDCNGVECLLSLSSISPDTLQSLETLSLSSLKNLCDLFSGQRAPPPPFPSNGTFSSLKTCKISGCPSIKELFPAGLMQNLKNLEVIAVLECKTMETIIAAAAGGGFMGEESNFSTSNPSGYSTDISLPKLRVLTLVCLPELQSIYNEGRIVSPLEEITAIDCLKLKRIAFSLPTPCLGKIKVKAYPKQWWDSVELHF
ncbi:disease resistance protein [Salix suchowensis]|nr:disease resistance protein [Salix suchowensis]